MSNVYYRGLQIWNVQTNMITQEPVRDDTGSDHVRNRTTISFTGIVHKKALNSVDQWKIGIEAASTPGGNSLDNFRTILETLNTPRGRFIFFIGTNRIWDIVPETSYLRDASSTYAADYGVTATTRVDIRNGPEISAKIMKVVGDHSCHVECTVTFEYLPCQSQSNWADLVSSLRWWVHDEIDCSTWFIGRTYRGRLEIKDRTVSPHWWQAVVLPPLLYGFKRKRISYEQSQDGFALDFTITDQQVYAQAPMPAVDWSGRVGLSSPFAGAGTKEITVDLTMTGHASARKLDMLTNMIYIMAAKTRWLSRTASADSIGFFPKLITIEELLQSNTVSASLVGEFVDPKDDFVDIVKDVFGMSLNYDETRPQGEQGIPGYDQRMPTYWLHDTSTIAGIFVAGIQSACSHNNYIQGGVIVPAGSGAPGTHDTGSGGMADNTPPQVVQAPQRSLQLDASAPYMSYKLSSRYRTVSGLLGLPCLAVDAQYANKTQFYRMHAPQMQRELMWEGSRLNKWPVMPNDDGWTDTETSVSFMPLENDVLANSVTVGADGSTLLYSALGKATYGMTRPFTSEEKLRVGIPPFVLQGDTNLADIISIPATSRVGGFKFEAPGNSS